MTAFRALVVSAHPDDIEFACAGTVAGWVDAGAEVTYCIVTDGSTGTQDRSLMGTSLSELRKRESQEAAEVVGAKEIVWLDYRDGYVEYSLDLRRDIARVFRTVRPHRYLVMDPGSIVAGWFVNHPDHRAVGQASMDVVLTAGTTPGHFPELLDEGVEPWRGLREMWIMGPGERAHIVDISAQIDRKVAALRCHASQIGDPDGTERFVRQFTAEQGKAHGFAHAESFQVINRGPGFHDEDVPDDIEVDLATPPIDPRSAPTRPQS
ncbi:MAG: PIG-L deacetylase family protein [Actinomycetota bacterium]